MALQKDTVSINLAKGVNTKTDDKIAQPDQTSVLNDGRFNKDFAVDKRNGLTAQGTTTQITPTFINTPVIGTCSMPTKVFAHENQLCLNNNGNLWSQFDGQDKWIFKGTCVPVEVTNKKIESNVTFRDVASVAGLTVAVGGQYIYVLEEATGNILTKTLLSGSETTLKTAAFGSAAWVFTYGSASTTLFARQISLTTGSVGTATTIKTDFQPAVTANGSRSITTFSLTKTSTASVLSEVNFITYLSSTSGDTVFFPFTASGTIPSIGSGTAATNGVDSAYPFSIYIEPSVNPNKIYFANSSYVKSFTFSTSSYTPVYSVNYTASTTPYSSAAYNNITMGLSPIDNSTLYVYIDTLGQDTGTAALAGGGNSGTSNDDIVGMITVNSGGTVTGNSIYGRGYRIASTAIRDSVRKTIYLPVTYISPLQATVFLADTLEGRSGTLSYIVGKTLSTYAASPTSGYLPQSDQVGSTSTYRVTNNGYFVDFNFHPTNAQASQYFAKTSHLTGGLLWAYDGDVLSEHNFLLYPEIVTGQFFNTNGALAVNIIQGGGVGTAEITQFSFAPGNAFSGANSLTFTTISGTTRIAHTIAVALNGVTDVPGTTGTIGVLSTDTAADVAYRVAYALGTSSIANAVISISSDTAITVRNTVTGTVADASVSSSIAAGTFSAGLWSYIACYKYTDRNNQIYRSTTSDPTTVNVTAGTASITVVVQTPPVTNKPEGSVYLELYRTNTVNGSVYHLMYTGTISMSGSISRVLIQDNGADNSSNALLYTTGGILDNTNIGACTTISYFKERLVVNNNDDTLATYYSKSVVVGEPVNFAAELNFRVDADQSAITAYHPMDDKLCIFKNPFIYIVSGDGANDLGEGSSLTQPLLVASDVGANNPNSLVLYPRGLLFKSRKGIYELSRGLGVSYIGAPVELYNSNQISGAILMDSVTEIRFPLADTNLGLIYNYFYNRWDFFTGYQADSACVWQNTFVLAKNSGVVKVESATNFYDLEVGGGTTSYNLYLETPWLKLKGIQDFQRIYQVNFLGEYFTPHSMVVRVQYDYDSTQTGTYTFNATQVLEQGTASVYQFLIHLAKQKCQAIKISFTEVPESGSQRSLIMNDLSAVVGLKKGLFKLRPGKQL